MKQKQVYTPYFCEENIWKFISSFSEKDEIYAVFVSNKIKQTPIIKQKINEALVVWDYHVIAVRKSPNGSAFVYDFDTSLDFPCDFLTYVTESFGYFDFKSLNFNNHAIPKELMNKKYLPFFRVVEGRKYLMEFASDRSHMQENGKFVKPPPPYAPIQTNSCKMNLMDYINCESRSPGSLMDITEFYHFGCK